MQVLRRLSRLVILSLLAGSACSASEELPKAGVMSEAASVSALQAGIELAPADTESEQGAGPLVLFFLSNPREEAARVLKWNTPLEEELSADVFLVARDGKPVDYLGRMVKRGTPQEQDYVDVPAGGRIESTVDIGRYYDITEPGTYTVAYKHVQADGITQLNQETAVKMSADTLSFAVSQ